MDITPHITDRRRRKILEHVYRNRMTTVRAMHELDLRQTHLDGAELCGANLSGSNLEGVTLDARGEWVTVRNWTVRPQQLAGAKDQ